MTVPFPGNIFPGHVSGPDCPCHPTRAPKNGTWVHHDTPEGTTMQKFYATFGVKYAHEAHPTLPSEFAHPDGVMAVIAPNMDIARAMVSAATGNAYCFLHPWPENGTPEIAKMEHFFPAGVNCTLMVQPGDQTTDAVTA